MTVHSITHSSQHTCGLLLQNTSFTWGKERYAINSLQHFYPSNNSFQQFNISSHPSPVTFKRRGCSDHQNCMTLKRGTQISEFQNAAPSLHIQTELSTN